MREISERRQRDAMRLILSGRSDPQELCAALHISPEQLARWSARPATLATLHSLRQLADVSTQLLVSRYRAHATARLLELMADSDTAETARKACVDLLQLNLAGTGAIDQNGEPDAGVDLETLRQFLAELGRSADPPNEEVTP